MELSAIGKSNSGDDIEAYAQGQAGLARELNKVFKTAWTRQTIQSWIKHRPGNAPAFPHRAPNNTFPVSECADWVRKWIYKKNGAHDLDIFQRAATERAQGDIDREQHEAWQREVERGGWIKKTDHERALIGAARITQTIFDQAEREAPVTISKITRELGLSGDVEALQRKFQVEVSAFFDRVRQRAGKINESA